VPLSDVLVQRFQRVELVVLAEEAGEVGGVGVHGVGVGQFDVRREERVGRETERAQQTAGGGEMISCFFAIIILNHSGPL
jgi:hypothetical protein